VPCSRHSSAHQAASATSSPTTHTRPTAHLIVGASIAGVRRVCPALLQAKAAQALPQHQRGLARRRARQPLLLCQRAGDAAAQLLHQQPHLPLAVLQHGGLETVLAEQQLRDGGALPAARAGRRRVGALGLPDVWGALAEGRPQLGVGQGVLLRVQQLRSRQPAQPRGGLGAWVRQVQQLLELPGAEVRAAAARWALVGGARG
jgi:hypothetical protein